MGTTKKAYRWRTTTIGLACAALLAGGAGTAVAAPSAVPDLHSRAVAAAAATSHEKIDVKASAKSVKAGESVTLSGRTKGIPTGSKLTVQHLNKGKWTTLHASTKTKHGGHYSVKVKLGKKGKEKLRVAHGKTHSSTVTVTVH
ncbi:hypothetical protein MOV08_11185 [Streptomyces yunnanensis]|uniref:Bacterial Ig domain-containing protein n=1 Tax=Streptomyces yunnanensis TaxID=156453 RepID=A0A9X8R006_9ACTN|nr:hypothetical protein [Streptomyces yunnanensis]WEB39780.1 hypothetical protein MOV08_11185 [Streptomyces yunnanensis]SHN29066.1 hypothetical protein SAMN05216268_13044 [Streptomyces yunnanensis]